MTTQMTGSEAKLKIMKRSGKEEVFDPSKLKASLCAAGLSPKMATTIVSGIGDCEGLSTQELRDLIITKLRRVNPTIARNYAQTRAFTVHSAPEIGLDSVHLHPDALRELHLQQSEPIHVEYGERTVEVTADPQGDLPVNEIWADTKTLQSLNMPRRKAKVIVHRKRIPEAVKGV
jgi:hypothetical protein